MLPPLYNPFSSAAAELNLLVCFGGRGCNQHYQSKGDVRDKTGDAFDSVSVHMLFEVRLMDPVLEVFVGEVDAKLIWGFGWWTC